MTDGVVLDAIPSPSVPTPAPIPPFAPIAIPAAVFAALGGLPVSGIAYDPLAGIMYIASGGPAGAGFIVGVFLAPGLPIAVAPWPSPPPLGPVVGLEWDGATASLWAVDVVGFSANVFAGGAPAPGGLVPPHPAFVGPAGDIAIDKMGTLNPAGFRPLYVSDLGGPGVVDVNDPGSPPFPSGVPADGLAFANSPAQVPPLPFGATCGACPAAHPGPMLNFTFGGPMTAGNPGWGIGVSGAGPASIVIHAFDFAVFNPAFPLFAPSGCPLGLLITPTLVLIPGFTGGGTTATLGDLARRHPAGRHHALLARPSASARPTRPASCSGRSRSSRSAACRPRARRGLRGIAAKRVQLTLAAIVAAGCRAERTTPGSGSVGCRSLAAVPFAGDRRPRAR